MAACSLTAAILCFASYRGDCGQLRATAETLTTGADSPSERVRTLLEWVYRNGGSSKNQRYFVSRRLGATPVHVMAEGGDCADKSRLLCALLRELHIPATMAMCFVRESGVPIHTLVEAKVEDASYMAVDPAYNLYFPKPEGRGYFGLLDLRNDPQILERRVDELYACMPPLTKTDRYYLRASAPYNLTSTINWDKNFITAFLHRQLEARYGDGVYRLPRPMVLEEPKLFVAALSLALTAMILFVEVSAGWMARIWYVKGISEVNEKTKEWPAAPSQAQTAGKVYT